MKVPLLTSFEGCRADRIGRDLLAGLTVWAVLVPEALAYATIAGVSPVIGLYAAPAALLLYALFGSSRQLVVGPMAATAALSGAAVAGISSDVDAATLTAGLALLVGVLGILAGLARLGFLASFISEPVLKGFIVGLALTIIVGQLPKLFGVSRGEGDFFEKTWHLVTSLGGTNGWTLAVGAGSLAVVLVLHRVSPRLPAPLVAVVLGIVAVSVFDLDAEGVEIVGRIEGGLPPLGLPSVSGSDYAALLASAAGILLVAFAEGIGAAKNYAAQEHYEIDPNQELLGVGAANIGAGLSSGMIVNGSLSKTAVNASAGAVSQISGIVVAALTVMTLLFLTGLFANLPEATLAAVVIAAVMRLVDVRGLRKYARLATPSLRRIYGVTAYADFLAAASAMVGVLVLDILPGLFLGVAVSVLLLLFRASRPHVAELGRTPDRGRWVDLQRHPDAVTEPGIVVLRPEAGLIYANADNVAAAVRGHVHDDTRAVVLDTASVPGIDITAVEMLDRLYADLEHHRIRLLFAGEIGQVRDLLDATGIASVVTGAHPTVDAAVTAARRNLDHPPDTDPTSA
ncbi:SulP family inorganic anion transporter [Rhodococcus rhodochrous]|uniref:Sulfate transporter n=1 Tax=Rhodococcus rhodochrous KG-21 TaxID=1441923 RepID=A0A0M9WLW3_RHORH|nr:SulP family inorganic anion transporter [Rhodococcus rhodochrous]KOS53823.1 sulfate transporter [Rhodococcus rhodochrous KG-21]